MIFASCGFDGDVSEKIKSPNYGQDNTRKLNGSKEGESNGKFRGQRHIINF